MPYKKLTKEQMNAVEYDDNLLLTAYCLLLVLDLEKLKHLFQN